MKPKLLLTILLTAITLCSCHKEKPLQKELQLSEFSITYYGTVAEICLTATYPGKLTATLYLSQSGDLSNANTFIAEKTATTQEPYYFRFNPTNLQKSTDYWCQIEVGNEFSSKKTEVLKFTTLASDIIVTTDEVTNIGFTVASCSGSAFTTIDTISITSRGMCWSTNHGPSITDSHTSDGTGTGTFFSSLNNLTPNTIYYYRAYATSHTDTVYGSERSFCTLSYDFQVETSEGSTMSNLNTDCFLQTVSPIN